jgi:hypothetical protein
MRDNTIDVIKNVLAKLKDGQPVDAIETVSKSVHTSRGGGTSIDESIITPFAGDLIGAGKLHKDIFMLNNLYSEVGFDKDVGINRVPEAMDSSDRMRMVAAIKTFVDSAKSYGIDFYDIVSVIYHRISSKQHEKKHCLAILNYMHAIWAAKHMGADGILHIPDIPELKKLAHYISSDNVRRALDLDHLQSIAYYNEKTPLGHYPTVTSFDEVERVLDSLGVDYANTIICLDFDDTLVRKPEQHNLSGSRISELVTPIELDRVLKSLSAKGAVFTLLTARKYENDVDVKSIVNHIGGLSLSTLNSDNASSNSLRPFLSKAAAPHKLSNETYYVNNRTTPILFADMQGTLVGVNNKGTVILDFMKNVAGENPPYTIVMLDDDEGVLKNMHRTLEGSGYTFIGIKIQHPKQLAQTLIGRA